MPPDKDLFAEEQSMIAMSFGEHIEELRMRLILALMGLAVGIVLTFIPPLNLGQRIIKKMESPAKEALERFYAERARVREEAARKAQVLSPEVVAVIPAEALADAVRTLFPKLDMPQSEALKDRVVRVPMHYEQEGIIKTVVGAVEKRDALISLAPLEVMGIFFMVCLVAGLVLASPWVFYQLWAFVAAGLYRHERHYVTKFLPVSLGLFLTGVFLCFFGVLPITLSFLLEFNVWLGIEPTLRLADWMSFATLLPLVFGICFQTPLVMLFLERIGVFTVDDYKAKFRIAILIIFVISAVLTPGQDPFSMLLLALPMTALYALGILLVGRRKSETLADVAG
jgi:sec-independent protein translocase protein TatC